jgi:pilus assembly protein FimV
LPEHALLDRIIRGRAWIPLLGVLLVGIVAMQVEVLKLNAGIGRSLDRATALQGQNEQLRASVSELSDEQRIESLAAKKGMVMAAPAQIKFLKTGAATTAQALSSIHQPNATSFDATLTAANTAALAVSQPAAAPSATPSTTASTAASGAPSTAGTSGSAGASSTATSQTSGSAGTPAAGAPAGTGTSTGTTQTGGAGTGAAQSPSSPTTSTGTGTTTPGSTPAAGTTQQTSPANAAGGASIGVGAPPSGN